MYLRQLVLAVHDLDRTLDEACALFDTKPIHADPAMSEYGVRHAVFAVGAQYIELMEPTSDEAPAARFLARRGEGLYAVLLQCDDDRPYREAAERLGIRTILEHAGGDFRCIQLHPVDAGLPFILEIDQQPGGPDGPYYPAGNVPPEPRAAERARIDRVVVPAGGAGRCLVDTAEVRFDDAADGVTVHVTLADVVDDFSLAGVRFRLSRAR